MHRLSDEDLLKELTDRIEEKNGALFDLRMATARLEEVNRRLVESESLKGHFLSNIGHEINNPLPSSSRWPARSAASSGPGRVPHAAAAIQGRRSQLTSRCATSSAPRRSKPARRSDAAQVDVRALVERPCAFGRSPPRLECERPGRRAAAAFALRHRPGKTAADSANLLSNAVKFGGARQCR
jgi:hypothetical protein